MKRSFSFSQKKRPSSAIIKSRAADDEVEHVDPAEIIGWIQEIGWDEASAELLAEIACDEDAVDDVGRARQDSQSGHDINLRLFQRFTNGPTPEQCSEPAADDEECGDEFDEDGEAAEEACEDGEESRPLLDLAKRAISIRSSAFALSYSTTECKQETICKLPTRR